jgi:hypothetical protein
MGFADKLKALSKKAEDEAATHKDQVHSAVLKARGRGPAHRRPVSRTDPQGRS